MGAGGVVTGISEECDAAGVGGAPGVVSGEDDGSPSVVGVSVSVVVGVVVVGVMVVGSGGRVCTAVRGAQV